MFFVADLITWQVAHKAAAVVPHAILGASVSFEPNARCRAQHGLEVLLLRDGDVHDFTLAVDVLVRACVH